MQNMSLLDSPRRVDREPAGFNVFLIIVAGMSLLVLFGILSAGSWLFFVLLLLIESWIDSM